MENKSNLKILVNSPDFKDPNPKLEQYATPVDTVSEIIKQAVLSRISFTMFGENFEIHSFEMSKYAAFWHKSSICFIQKFGILLELHFRGSIHLS